MAGAAQPYISTACGLFVVSVGRLNSKQEIRAALFVLLSCSIKQSRFVLLNDTQGK